MWGSRGDAGGLVAGASWGWGARARLLSKGVAARGGSWPLLRPPEPSARGTCLRYTQSLCSNTMPPLVTPCPRSRAPATPCVLVQIAAAIKDNRTLKTLDVGGNNISEDGAKALASALKGNDVLQVRRHGIGVCVCGWHKGPGLCAQGQRRAAGEALWG